MKNYWELKIKKIVGLIIMILGTFIIVFDYPQIKYFNYLENEIRQILEKEKKQFIKKVLLNF